MEHFPWQGGTFGGHKVVGLYGAKGDGVIISAPVPHYAHGTHIGEGGKILPKFRGDAEIVYFLAVNGIRLLQNFHLVGGDFADYANTKPWPGEGLAVHQAAGQPQGFAHGANFVLKEQPQRFYYFLKIHVIRQAANIVVALYHRTFAKAAFNNVGVNRPLHQKIHRADFFGLFLKNANKFFADGFSFRLRVGYAL